MSALEPVEPVRVPPGPSVRQWSEKHGFSPELVARFVAFLPEPKEVLASLLKDVPRFVRVNTLRAAPARVRRDLEARGFSLTPVETPDPRLPAFRVDASPYAISATPEYLSGELYLQDLASLTAPAALGAEPGERILDMAAAPGGKTTAIAQMADDHASVLAVEPVPARAAALTANLRRLGVAGVAVAVRRAETLGTERLFDRVLLDAPCTGEGVLPRDPKRRVGSLDEHAALAGLQRRLLVHAARLVRPGGVLVYSTCTFAPEECEAAVEFAVGLGLEPEPLPFSALGGVPLAPALAEAGPLVFGDAVRHARRVYPHRHGTLGFFVARLRRPDDASVAVPASAVVSERAAVGVV